MCLILRLYEILQCFCFYRKSTFKAINFPPTSTKPKLIHRSAMCCQRDISAEKCRWIQELFVMISGCIYGVLFVVEWITNVNWVGFVLAPVFVFSCMFYAYKQVQWQIVRHYYSYQLRPILIFMLGFGFLFFIFCFFFFFFLFFLCFVGAFHEKSHLSFVFF